MSPIGAHEVIWGLGYRQIEDQFKNTYTVAMHPESRTQHLYSAFIQDQIELSPNQLFFTIGSKFEHTSYTGMEIQPSARLVWLPKEGHTLWASISRAVRTPSRFHDSVSAVMAIVPSPAGPLEISIHGSGQFESEVVTAFELGYRVQPLEQLSVDIALFHNRYRDLVTFEPTSLTDLLADNNRKVRSHGLELAMEWRPTEWWRLQANYSYLSLEELGGASTDTLSAGVIEGGSPKNQFYIRSSMDLRHNLSLDVWARYVGKMAATSFTNPPTVPEYTSLNARLAWRPKENIELSLVGLNLLDSRHLEYVGENFVTLSEVERSLFAQIRLEF